MRTSACFASVVALTLVLGCQGRRADSNPPTAGAAPPPPVPLLRTAPPDVWSSAETEMIATVGSFYEALLAALRDPSFTAAEQARTVVLLRKQLDPLLPAARKLASAYAALPPERHRALHHEVFQRYGPQVSAFTEAAGSWTMKFRDPHRQPEFRAITEQVLGPWARDGALWVVGGFGPDAIEEVEGWATGQRENEDRNDDERETARAEHEQQHESDEPDHDVRLASTAKHDARQETPP